jgi:hypothetical protein
MIILKGQSRKWQSRLRWLKEELIIAVFYEGFKRRVV